MSKVNRKSITTFNELTKMGYSSFEVVLLSAQKAVEIIRSADYLRPENDNLTPKVAVLALGNLIDKKSDLKELKENYIKNYSGESLDLESEESTTSSVCEYDMVKKSDKNKIDNFFIFFEFMIIN